MTACPRCTTPLDRLPALCPVCAAGPGRTAAPATRQLVAAYLTGWPVPANDLRAAWGETREDAEFTAHLRGELGLDADDSPCGVFRAQAATFAELPSSARDREAANLADHVRDCPACRRVLWQLRPVWDATGVLAEPLRVAVSLSGRVRDRGLGPPAVEVEYAALRAGPDDTNPVPLEWGLDPLRVRVSAGPRVAVWAEGTTGMVEFVAADGLSYFAGPLDDLPPGGLPLPPGRWACEVRLAADADQPRRFELDLMTGGDE